MRKVIRRTTLGLSLIGIGLGLGGTLLAPSAAETTALEEQHMDEGDTCVSGCDTEVEFCCIEEED